MATDESRPGDVSVEMRGSPMMVGVTIVASLLTMIVLGAARQSFGSVTLVEGAVVGVALSIGLYATGNYSGGMFEGQSTTLWAINTLHNVVITVVMGAVFAVWAKSPIQQRFSVRFAARFVGRLSLSLRAKRVRRIPPHVRNLRTWRSRPNFLSTCPRGPHSA